YWRYSLEGQRWIKQEGLVLKDEEKDMLRLASTGLTMNEIAERMCKSVDTVKFYRRNMFERLKFANITEALSFATNN
ncbi:UNVERIFIED_CONTAM: helix-turn-helix transcriptional regulator, partial [Prevotella sp. 15_C9]